MYIQPANSTESYRLYRSSVSDGKNWTVTPLSGLPAGDVALSQMIEYENQLYVTTTRVCFTNPLTVKTGQQSAMLLQ